MLTLVLAASEKSHVPFYITGAVLAVWAVVVSWIGLSRPSFPGSAVGARGVMLISVLLVAGTMVAAVVTG